MHLSRGFRAAVFEAQRFRVFLLGGACRSMVWHCPPRRSPRTLFRCSGGRSLFGVAVSGVSVSCAPPASPRPHRPAFRGTVRDLAEEPVTDAGEEVAISTRSADVARCYETSEVRKIRAPALRVVHRVSFVSSPFHLVTSCVSPLAKRQSGTANDYRQLRCGCPQCSGLPRRPGAG